MRRREGAIEDFKKTSPTRLEEIAREKGVDARDIEIWFADEARIGQKNKITRRWAKRGSRPSAPKDQRTASTYIFGAISPKDGKGAALVLPKCDTYAMNLHLAEIAKNVAPGAHAVLLARPGRLAYDRQARPFPPTSPSCRCRPNVRNSTRPRTSGSSCATTGSRTACSNPTTTSSTIVVSAGLSVGTGAVPTLLHYPE